MGGPGLLRVVGNAKTLATVEAPMDKKILVDMGAFHPLLVRASYNKSMPFDAVAFVKNTLLRKFEELDVEFFFDGDGNAEKYNTSMFRRNRQTELAAAEAKIQAVEDLASRGQGIKESDYKLLQKTLRGLAPVTFAFKGAIVQAMRAQGAVVFFTDGETDISIRQRSAELLASHVPFVVVGNDCDYAIHPTIPTLLRPKGRSKFIEYNIDILLSAAGFSRAQFQALGVVSHTDYSWNLPGLGIGNNSRIIKSISD
ncbi:hypothetical protein BGZ81_004619, partial [Podila clonocystis]